MPLKHTALVVGIAGWIVLGIWQVGAVSADASCAGTGMLLAVKTVGEHPTEGEFTSSTLIAIGSTGQTWAQGTVRTRIADEVFVADADLAQSHCASDGTLEELELAFHNPTNGARAVLRVIPGPPTARESLTARLELTTAATGAAQMDGAILVVSSADGPMP